MPAFSFDQPAIAKSHHYSAQRIAVNDEIVGDVGARHRKRDGYFARVVTDIPQREAQNKGGDARLRLKTTNHQLMNISREPADSSTALSGTPNNHELALPDRS